MSETRHLEDGSEVEVTRNADGELEVKWESGTPVGRIVPDGGLNRLYDPDGNELTPEPGSVDQAIQALCDAAEEAFWMNDQERQQRYRP